MSQDNVKTAADALATYLTTLTSTITDALEHYEHHPIPRFTLAYEKWKNTALRFLLLDLEKLKTASTNLSSKSAIPDMHQVADNQLHLSKNLDTFLYEFSGPAFPPLLEQGVFDVVKGADNLLKSLKGTVVQG